MDKKKPSCFAAKNFLLTETVVEDNKASRRIPAVTVEFVHWAGLLDRHRESVAAMKKEFNNWGEHSVHGPYIPDSRGRTLESYSRV